MTGGLLVLVVICEAADARQLVVILAFGPDFIRGFFAGILEHVLCRDSIEG